MKTKMSNLLKVLNKQKYCHLCRNVLPKFRSNRSNPFSIFVSAVETNWQVIRVFMAFVETMSKH